MATRHLVRTVVLQSLYEWDFYDRKNDITKVLERNLAEFAPGIDEPEFAWKILKGIAEHIKDIDARIVKTAPEWPLPKIAVIDRNILRIGLYELLYADKSEVPPSSAGRAVNLGRVAAIHFSPLPLFSCRHFQILGIRDIKSSYTVVY